VDRYADLDVVALRHGRVLAEGVELHADALELVGDLRGDGLGRVADREERGAALEVVAPAGERCEITRA
jgi:hypothetical protein